MRSRYYYSFIAALLIAFPLFGQNIQTTTINWNTASTFEVEQGTIADETNRIVSSTSHISWYGADNGIRSSMSITNTIGAWSNVASSGSITFNVSSDDGSDIVQFCKADGETKIRIHLIKEVGTVLVEFNVSNINVE